jgi:acetyl esterase
MTSPPTGPTLAGAVHTLRLLFQAPAFEARAPRYAAVPYRPLPVSRGTAPKADIYTPDGPGPHPSVVLVHGGGFLVGSRAMKPAVYLATRMAEAGFVVCVPSYRQIFRGGRLDAMVDDIRSALSWWLEHRQEYEADTEHCSLVAKSAGAAITMLASEEFSKDDFERLISIFGIYDLSSTSGLLGSLLPQFLLGSSKAEVAMERSPIARPPLPFPTTLLHGTADRLVPYEQATRLFARRQDQGAQVELITYQGEEHSWFSDATASVCQKSMSDILNILTSTKSS